MTDRAMNTPQARPTIDSIFLHSSARTRVAHQHKITAVHKGSVVMKIEKLNYLWLIRHPIIAIPTEK